MSPFPEWLWIVFPLFIAGGWILSLQLLAILSGWALLARRFRYKRVLGDESWGFQSARMKFYIRYGNCLNIGADVDAIYLSVFPIVRMGHPPLRIPWEEIAVKAQEYGIVFKYREMLLGREELVPFRISKSLAKKMELAAGRSWPVETFGAP